VLSQSCNACRGCCRSPAMHAVGAVTVLQCMPWVLSQSCSACRGCPPKGVDTLWVRLPKGAPG